MSQSVAPRAHLLAGVVLVLAALSASLQGCAVTPAVLDEAEPIPIDSRDPRYSRYLSWVRDMIKAKWGYPCVQDGATGKCEYKSAHLVVEFGIFTDGRLAHVVVKESSGMTIYDESAVGAIKAASPFPPVPPALMATARPGSAGVRIVAKFNYLVETRRL